jgi:hypothetical protein
MHSKILRVTLTYTHTHHAHTHLQARACGHTHTAVARRGSRLWTIRIYIGNHKFKCNLRKEMRTPGSRSGGRMHKYHDLHSVIEIGQGEEQKKTPGCARTTPMARKNPRFSGGCETSGTEKKKKEKKKKKKRRKKKCQGCARTGGMKYGKHINVQGPTQKCASSLT